MRKKLREFGSSVQHHGPRNPPVPPGSCELLHGPVLDALEQVRLSVVPSGNRVGSGIEGMVHQRRVSLLHGLSVLAIWWSVHVEYYKTIDFYVCWVLIL